MRPKLIHPVPCTIANVDTDAAHYNPVFKEPTKTGGVTQYGTAFEIKAQVHYNTGKLVNPMITGFQERGDGYLFAKEDDAALVNQRAKISKIGSRDVEYYVTEKRPKVHYTDANMVMLIFASKDKGE